MKPRAVFQFIDSRTIGGIESHLLLLAKTIQQRGYQCEVLFWRMHPAHPVYPKLVDYGIAYRSAEGSFTRLCRILRQQPSLLATHGYKAGVIGRLAGLLTGCPVVSTFHSGDPGRGRVRLYSFLDQLTSPLATRCLSVSREIQQRLPVKSQQVHNFVDCGQQECRNGQQVAFVGRLSHEKGPDLFARICNEVHLPAVVYGDGPMTEFISRQPMLDMAGQVNMDHHWHKIGVLCITSRHEGLPLVALEAMSRGIPVISFAIGGLPELIRDGQNGWLIQPEDIEGFKRALMQWQQLTELQRARMARAAQQTIESEYSCDAVVPEILLQYQWACAEKSARRKLRA